MNNSQLTTSMSSGSCTTFGAARRLAVSPTKSPGGGLAHRRSSLKARNRHQPPNSIPARHSATFASDAKFGLTVSASSVRPEGGFRVGAASSAARICSASPAQLSASQLLSIRERHAPSVTSHVLAAACHQGMACGGDGSNRVAFSGSPSSTSSTRSSVARGLETVQGGPVAPRDSPQPLTSSSDAGPHSNSNGVNAVLGSGSSCSIRSDTPVATVEAPRSVAGLAAGPASAPGGGPDAAAVGSVSAVGLSTTGMSVVAVAGGQLPTPSTYPCSLVEDTTEETWRTPLRRPGSVVALGKFDALHRGHRALAAAAAAMARAIALTRPANSGGGGFSDTGSEGSYGSSKAIGCSNGASSSDCSAGKGAGGAGAKAAAAAAALVQGEASPSGGASDEVVAPSSGAAATAGDAVLLSFSGMAAVLGWLDKLPLTAPQDRGRVLAGWAAACAPSSAVGDTGSGSRGGPVLRDRDVEAGAASGVTGGCSSVADASATASTSRSSVGAAPPPRLRTMPFALIRNMSPEEFVALLARDLGAAGVVAGRNYRFGYKAAGDADTLVRLGEQYGMRVCIVDLVQLPDAYRSSGRSPSCMAGGAGAGGGSRSGSPPMQTAVSSRQGGRGADGVVKASQVSRAGMRAVGADLNDVTPIDATSSGSSRSGGSSSNDGSGGGGGGADVGGGVGGSLRLAMPVAALLGSRDSEAGCTDTDSGIGGSVYASTDLEAEVEELAAAAVAGCRSTGGGGSGGGGRSGGESTSRVSSSRIRTLLASGHVESVEQLLGRKYRLVCDLAAAALTDCSVTETCGSGGGGLGGANVDPLVRVSVPYSGYQNQPPANGRYTALVRLVTDEYIAASVDWAAEDGAAAESLDEAGASAVLGQACMLVTLSDTGLEVDVPRKTFGLRDGIVPRFLLIDFDACGV